MPEVTLTAREVNFLQVLCHPEGHVGETFMGGKELRGLATVRLFSGLFEALESSSNLLRFVLRPFRVATLQKQNQHKRPKVTSGNII